jgi:predicted site-specific integrase-resolvase
MMIRKHTSETPNGQLIGYARVSTDAQDFSAQVDRLKSAGCSKVFSEKQSGAKRDRMQLAAALEYVREGRHLHLREGGPHGAKHERFSRYHRPAEKLKRDG